MGLGRRMGSAQRAVIRKLAVWLVLAMLIVWPMYRIYGYLNAQPKSYDAAELLYQVAQFEIELLNSALLEAGKAKTTGELDSLRLAAYSADFTHERLTLAIGENRLVRLSSIERLLQYVLRLQIGGSRTVKADEKETLERSAQLFKAIYEGYGKLLTPSGSPSSSQNEKLKKLDDELAELLKKKLLP